MHYLTVEQATAAGILNGVALRDWWFFDDARLMVLTHDPEGTRDWFVQNLDAAVGKNLRELAKAKNIARTRWSNRPRVATRWSTSASRARLRTGGVPATHPSAGDHRT